MGICRDDASELLLLAEAVAVAADMVIGCLVFVEKKRKIDATSK